MAIDAATESAIGRVPWGTLEHFGGQASDLPDLLRAALGAARASERAEARAALRERVIEQGAASEATAHVAAILGGALGSAPADDLAQLVALLAQLAYVEARDDARRGAWARATWRAIWGAERALLERLATTGDDDLLVQLPFALVALIDGAGEGAPQGTDLDAKAREIALAIAVRARRPATDEAHAGFAFALGRLARRVPELLPALRGALDRAAWPAKVASAIGVLRVAPGDEAATDVVIEALRRRDQHAAWTSRRFPWHAGHLRFFLVAVLAGDRVSDAGLARALPVLAEVARRDASPATFEQDCLRPLARALDGIVITPATRRADLPHVALALLDALYDNPAMWAERSAELDDALRSFGLSADLGTWRALLERT